MQAYYQLTKRCLTIIFHTNRARCVACPTQNQILNHWILFHRAISKEINLLNLFDYFQFDKTKDKNVIFSSLYQRKVRDEPDQARVYHRLQLHPQKYQQKVVVQPDRARVHHRSLSHKLKAKILHVVRRACKNYATKVKYHYQAQ